MKKATLKNVILAGAVVFAVIITAFSYGVSSAGNPDVSGGNKTPLPRPESINGSSEFNFVPVDDNRVWHVENKYKTIESCGEYPCNNSTYLFSSDSVFVVNEYAGVPNQSQWDIVLAQSLLNANSFHN